MCYGIEVRVLIDVACLCMYLRVGKWGALLRTRTNEERAHAVRGHIGGQISYLWFEILLDRLVLFVQYFCLWAQVICAFLVFSLTQNNTQLDVCLN